MGLSCYSRFSFYIMFSDHYLRKSVNIIKLKLINFDTRCFEVQWKKKRNPNNKTTNLFYFQRSTFILQDVVYIFSLINILNFFSLIIHIYNMWEIS